MPTTLVGGATGYLGRYLVAELHRRGHSVRAIVRDRGRAEADGPCGSPSLDGLVDEWAVGKVDDPRFTRALAAGVDHVVSALGVTRQKADPWTIDNLANLAILNSALEHEIRSFTYINVLGGDHCPTELTRAKSAFAQTLAAADLRSQIINPPAYFSDMLEVLGLAKRGLVPLFRPRVRINPIHGADLASFTVDRVEAGDSGSWDVGGPDVFSWDELARTAFTAVGKRPRVLKVPSRVLTPLLRLTALFSPRLADTARFTTWNMLHDCVAPATGSRHLADFYVANSGR